MWVCWLRGYTYGTTMPFGWNILNRSSYSPDLPPWDYHLFISMKVFMNGKMFPSDSEMKGRHKKMFPSLTTCIKSDDDWTMLKNNLQTIGVTQKICEMESRGRLSGYITSTVSKGLQVTSLLLSENRGDGSNMIKTGELMNNSNNQNWGFGSNKVCGLVVKWIFWVLMHHFKLISNGQTIK